MIRLALERMVVIKGSGFSPYSTMAINIPQAASAIKASCKSPTVLPCYHAQPYLKPYVDDLIGEIQAVRRE